MPSLPCRPVRGQHRRKHRQLHAVLARHFDSRNCWELRSEELPRLRCRQILAIKRDSRLYRSNDPLIQCPAAYHRHFTGRMRFCTDFAGLFQTAPLARSPPELQLKPAICANQGMLATFLQWLTNRLASSARSVRSESKQARYHWALIQSAKRSFHLQPGVRCQQLTVQAVVRLRHVQCLPERHRIECDLHRLR